MPQATAGLAQAVRNGLNSHPKRWKHTAEDCTAQGKYLERGKARWASTGMDNQDPTSFIQARKPNKVLNSPPGCKLGVGGWRAAAGRDLRVLVDGKLEISQQCPGSQEGPTFPSASHSPGLKNHPCSALSASHS